MMDSVKKAQEIINEKLAPLNRKMEEITAALEQDEQIIKQKEEALKEAEAENNAEKYLKTKKDIEDAVNVRDMHTRIIEKLNDGTLISEEEYKRLANDILEEYEAQVKASKKQLATLSEKMKKIADSLREDANAAEATLKKLQRDLYRNFDRKKDRRGNYIFNDELQLGPHVYAAVHWGEVGTNYWLYKEYQKEITEDE